MFRDRLVPDALRLAQSRIVAPIIVETEIGKLYDVFEETRPFLGEIELLPRLIDFSPLGAWPFRLMKRFSMFAGILPREVIFDLAEDDRVAKIYPDRIVETFQYPTVPSYGVFEAYRRPEKPFTFTSTWWTKRVIGAVIANEKGYRGRGVLVGIVDTGASRVHEQIRRVEFETLIKTQHRDENGHGSWCTSCVGGVPTTDTYLSDASGKRVLCEGMAPECGLLAIKALGYYIGCGSTSGIIEGIQMGIDRGASIISLSLGSNNPPETKPEDDAFYPVFEEGAKYGVIPVCAAGNAGPEEGSVGSPGNLPNCLSIGAYNPVTGDVAEFSSRGPTKWGAIRPDCTMPGVNTDSASVGICDIAGDGKISRYSPISGTSMATPHASGILALMCEAFKRRLGKVLTLDGIKRMLEALCDHPKNNDAGWGSLTWQKFEQWMEGEYDVEL